MRRLSPFVLSFVALTIVGCGSEEVAPGEVDQDAAADAVADGVSDTTVTPGDTAVDDTEVTDTGSADTATADTATSDTRPSDTGAADTRVADTTAADTTAADTSADTTAVDTSTDASATDAAATDADAAAADAADVSADANLPALPNAEIWVSRVGDGSGTLTSASAAAFIVRYQVPAKTTVGSTIALPTAAAASNFALTLSGTATSEGQLLRSVNGTYVTMVGYDSAAGVASVKTAATHRTIARIDASANIDTSTRTTTYAGESARSAITNDGAQYWLTGDGSSGGIGVSYLSAHGTTAAATAISTGFNSLRVVNIFGGALYGTGGSVRIFDFGGTLPTTATAPVSITDATGGQPYGIVGFDLDNAVAGIDTIYVCDDRAIATGGGVQRWKKGSGTPPYTLSATLKDGFTGTAGCLGLTGMIVGSDVVLFLVTKENPSRVGAMVDVGGAATSATFDPIATAASGSHFRGVALAPQ